MVGGGNLVSIVIWFLIKIQSTLGQLIISIRILNSSDENVYFLFIPQT